jgi:hypothetical protein
MALEKNKNLILMAHRKHRKHHNGMRQQSCRSNHMLYVYYFLFIILYTAATIFWTLPIVCPHFGV